MKYKDALEKTLKQSNMTQATLDAMIEAIKEEAPNFRKYFILIKDRNICLKDDNIL